MTLYVMYEELNTHGTGPLIMAEIVSPKLDLSKGLIPWGHTRGLPKWELSKQLPGDSQITQRRVNPKDGPSTPVPFFFLMDCWFRMENPFINGG